MKQIKEFSSLMHYHSGEDIISSKKIKIAKIHSNHDLEI